MRTLLKIVVPVEAGNRAIKDGSLPKTMKWLGETIKPEAAYFTTENGKRTAYYVFDLKDPSQMPVIGEPLFQNLGADVQYSPVMNADELKSGLEKLAKGNGKVPVGV